ncbi:MAG: molecular chaperone [Candidatus Tectimicrobiota bacterium]
MSALLTPEARRDLYALLARLFAAEVDVPLYQALVQHESLGWIEETLRAQSPEAAVEALAVEFCRLFIGPQPACVPYASAQQGEALLGGRSRSRLETFLHEVRFAYDPVTTLLASPDHVAVTLAVLAYLSASPEMAERVPEFMQAYVLPWVPAYCRQLGSAASLQLYRTAAALTLALLDEEGRNLTHPSSMSS